MEATAKVAGNFARWEMAFYNALVRAQQAGEISAGRDLRALARFFLNNLEGLRVLSKVSPERAALQAMVPVMLSVLE
jgi:TetR/AcrR family transcriptional repressor of nem operon